MNKLNTPKTVKYSCNRDKENLGSIVPNKWLKPINNKITWHIDESYLSSDMEKYKIIFAFSKAFDYWQPLLGNIVIESTGDITKAQVVIRFMVNGNAALPEAFEEGVLAYTYAPNGESLGRNSDMYFNDSYKWNDILTLDGILLFLVVVHEFGHALGAGHSTVTNDIMGPYYNPNAGVFFSKDTLRWVYNTYKAYGVTDPDVTNADTLSLTRLFNTKGDISRLAVRQVKVLCDYLNITYTITDKFAILVNKVYNSLYE